MAGCTQAMLYTKREHKSVHKPVEMAVKVDTSQVKWTTAINIPPIPLWEEIGPRTRPEDWSKVNEMLEGMNDILDRGQSSANSTGSLLEKACGN